MINSRPPYSVLRLLVRGHKDGNNGGSTETSSQRKDLFRREIAAEAQTRTEVLDYVDTLVNVEEHKEAYGWIWPLEDYRRTRWSEEMIKAFPILQILHNTDPFLALELKVERRTYGAISCRVDVVCGHSSVVSYTTD